MSTNQQSTNQQSQNAPLDEQNMLRWFNQISPKLWENTVYLEKNESWVNKDKDAPINLAVNKLAQYLTQNINTQTDDTPRIAGQRWASTLITALSHSSSRRSIMVLGLLANLQPGIGGDLLDHCINNINNGVNIAENNVFHARLKILIRMQCYQRIFNAERRSHIIKIIEEELNE